MSGIDQSEGVEEERLEIIKVIAGSGTLDERCNRLLPYIHFLFDIYLGPAMSTPEQRKRRRLEAAAKRQAMLDHAAWKAERDRTRVAA